MTPTTPCLRRRSDDVLSCIRPDSTPEQVARLAIACGPNYYASTVRSCRPDARGRCKGEIENKSEIILKRY